MHLWEPQFFFFNFILFKYSKKDILDYEMVLTIGLSRERNTWSGWCETVTPKILVPFTLRCHLLHGAFLHSSPALLCPSRTFSMFLSAEDQFSASHYREMCPLLWSLTPWGWSLCLRHCYFPPGRKPGPGMEFRKALHAGEEAQRHAHQEQGPGAPLCGRSPSSGIHQLSDLRHLTYLSVPGSPDP